MQLNRQKLRITAASPGFVALELKVEKQHTVYNAYEEHV